MKNERDGWRDWFAWRPVKIQNQWRWLETVQTAQVMTEFDIRSIYRLKNHGKEILNTSSDR